MKIMKNIESHARVTNKNQKQRVQCENHDNHEYLRIPSENY